CCASHTQPLSSLPGEHIHGSNNNNDISTMAGGPAEMKVLGMLWKQAATGVAIGVSAAFVYYQGVTKQDGVKIDAYYAKQDAAAKQ
ncbi:unnamed protein product, partial [Ectocarpus sp. 12 AP-2014]